MKIIRIPKGKYAEQLISKDKYYPVRAGNNLTALKRWAKWAKNKYPEQKLILADNLKNMQDKLSIIRRKAGYDSRYTIYGSY